ncbi:M20/M25/M40 family metallo-hydrolase [Methylobacterium terricola]|uniref:M20/M25/M40 family metallo-hydrolase n=1 Tax=Methylobacterium terricola TaxID=2583531 RepID=UPI001FEC6FFA|nr:M20/M25/M40 family metallo-hydrolase [Methylobacterium terricola]
MPLHLALSHDEEVGCLGVRSLIARMAARPLRPRLCLVGEPTAMRIAIGHKGKLAARACAHGGAGHAALAPGALDAIYLACDVVDRLRLRQGALARSRRSDTDDDVPSTTIPVGRIDGGTALTIVPERCTLDFEIRNVSGVDAGAILDLLRQDAKEIVAAERGRFTCAEIETVIAYPALDTPPAAEVVAFAKALVEDEGHCKVAFGTEGGLFREGLSIPTVVCGPGPMDQGHRPDEFIALDHLAAAGRMMDRLLARLRI